MSKIKLPDPYNIDENRAQEMLEKLQEVLWVDDKGNPDPDKEWDSETLDALADILEPLRPCVPAHLMRRVVYRVELLLPIGEPGPAPTPAKLGELLVHQGVIEQQKMAAHKSYALRVDVTHNEDLSVKEMQARLPRLGYPEDHFGRPEEPEEPEDVTR